MAKREIDIPTDFDRALIYRVLELEDRGVKTTVNELIIKYARIGFKSEKL
jgi:hypothetical protein